MVRPLWFILRPVLVLGASLAAALACYGAAAWLLGLDPPLVGLVPLPALAGFWVGAGLWLIGEYEADIRWTTPLYALSLVALGVSIVVGAAYFPGHPVRAQIAHAAIAVMAGLSLLRVPRDLWRWVRTRDRAPRSGGPKIGGDGHRSGGHPRGSSGAGYEGADIDAADLG